MNPKNQVNTYEQGIKLKELGVWNSPYGKGKRPFFIWVYKGEKVLPWYEAQGCSGEIWEAYTVAELMEMLPKDRYVLRIKQHSHGGVSLSCEDLETSHYQQHANGLSIIDSLAKLLIMLIENGHIKPEEL